MAVTSQLRATPGRFDVAIAQWRAAGLLKPSAVKPVFATLEQALVLRRLGALDTADRDALRKAIQEMLGCGARGFRANSAKVDRLLRSEFAPAC